MAHRRAPELSYIPVSRIKADASFRHDRLFTALYKQHVLGNLKSAFTRIEADKITTGFAERENGLTVNHTQIKPENVALFENLIRRGARPAVYLYWSPLVLDGKKYVCPDDEDLLAAYRKLGIGVVPALILRPNSSPSLEGAVWIEKKAKYVDLDRCVGAKVETYAMFFGTSDPEFSDLIEGLVHICAKTRESVKKFHLEGAHETQYHQMLHAILLRHERALDSIRRLVDLRRVEHAEIIARVAYEAFLNFYLDWLSPEFFGPRLQLLAKIRENKIFLSISDNDNDVRVALKSLGNLVNLFEKTLEKARLSPLGEYFYRNFYPKSSFISHQYYSNIELEADDFSEEYPLDRTSQITQLGRWLDAITAALVSRIRNEVGVSAADL